MTSTLTMDDLKKVLYTVAFTRASVIAQDMIISSYVWNLEVYDFLYKACAV